VNQFAVIGLGRFGGRVAVGLYENGAEVIAVDDDPEKVDDIKTSVTAAVTMDATDEEALRQLNVEELDAVVVAIGKDIEASILVTTLLKELGAHHVVARASTAIQAKILDRVGADRVIYPEDDMAARLVRSLTSPHILDHIELEGDIDLAQVIVPQSFVGHTLKDLDLRNRFGVWVVIVRPKEGPVTVADAEYKFREGDHAYVMGRAENIERWDKLE